MFLFQVGGTCICHSNPTPNFPSPTLSHLHFTFIFHCIGLQVKREKMAATRKRQRTSSPPPTTSSSSFRSADEWEKLEGGSVLLLPPTTAIVRNILHTSQDAPPSTAVKIAAFDMDDTIIKPASGGVFAKDDPADWQWVHPAVAGHLRHLYESGFLVVLFSNQMGIGKGTKWNAAKADAITAKVALLSRDMNVPLCACVATRDDVWRKPSPQLWSLLKTRVTQCVTGVDDAKPGGTTVDCDAYSFYVGDAAGRSTPTLAGRKKDFSCSDRQFAYNIQLPFFTPEQFFRCDVQSLLEVDPLTSRPVLDTKAATSADPAQPSFRLSTSLLRLTAPPADIASPTDSFSWGDVSPQDLQNLPTSYAGLSLQAITPVGEQSVTLPPDPPFFTTPPHAQEMILFVGFPGCGKSSFYRRHLQPYGYRYVNRDTLQTRAKCIRAAEEYWTSGHSVVVDNTNPTAEDRQVYIDIVKRHATSTQTTTSIAGSLPALPVRIFYFTHSRGLANHMNLVRAFAETVPRVPSIAYNVFQSKLQLPSTAAEVASLNISAVWKIPAVACFDDASPETKRAFYFLL